MAGMRNMTARLTVFLVLVLGGTLMRRTVVLGVAVIIFTCLGLPFPTLAKKDKLNISVVLDDKSLQGKPQQVTSAWLGYAMARANWISEHVKVNSPEAKSYTRTFEEEVTGRDSLATIWGELKANQPGLTDAYLDQLQKVKDAGLMREYVWTNLRPPAWTLEPADLQLAHYGEWAKVNLVGHLVETHADARMGE